MTETRHYSLWMPLLSGILLALSTPAFGMWPLVMFALIPYFLFLFTNTSRAKHIIGTLLMAIPYCAGQGTPLFRLAGTWWPGEHSVAGISSMGLYALGILGIIIWASLFYLIPVTVYRRSNTQWAFPSITFAFVWAVTEFIRSAYFLAGYSWGVVGYALIETTYIKHFAALFSVFGLSFIAVLFSALVARLTLGFRDTQGSLGMRLRYALFANTFTKEMLVIISLFAMVILFGVVREAKGPLAIGHVRVAVIASALRTEESLGAGAYRSYRALMQEAFAEHPNLLLLPENVFPYFQIDEVTRTLTKSPSVYLPSAPELYTDFLALSVANPTTTIALPAHTKKNGASYNSILLYVNGVITGIYHKRHPVPFTEYSPKGFDLPLFEEISKGEPLQPLSFDGIALDAAICSEIDIVPFAATAAHFILSPSNDSALKGAEIVRLHDQFARMRALETGAYMLRSTKGGVSSVIDPYGRPLQSAKNANKVLVVDIK